MPVGRQRHHRDPGEEPHPVGSEWSSYLRLSGFKSLAVAGNLNGVYVSGFAHAYPLPQLAVDEALDRCEERRADRRIADPCRTYAIGDEIAEEAK